MQTSFLIDKTLLTFILILGLSSSFAFAAGPRPKDFYLNVGGGVFTPDFVLNKNTTLKGVDGESNITYISAPLVGTGQPLRLIGLAGDGDVGKPQPENRSILSLGGALGYKYNRNINFEVHLDLGFPNILVKNLNLNKLLDSDVQSTARIHILAPNLLPIGASVTYTFLPNSVVSPYVGVGALIALLDNRRIDYEATDILVIDGGVEFGYLIHAGAFLDLTSTKFGFFDLKFASIDSPEFTTRQGTPSPVDRVDIRHIRVGMGTRF